MIKNSNQINLINTFNKISHLFKVGWTANDVNFLDADAPWSSTEGRDRNLKLDFANRSTVSFDRQSKVAQCVLLKRQILELDFAYENTITQKLQSKYC